MRCHRKMNRNREDKLKICAWIDRLRSVCLLCSPRAAVIKWLALFYVCMWFWCASISLLYKHFISSRMNHFFFFSQLLPVSIYSVEFYNSITAVCQTYNSRWSTCFIDVTYKNPNERFNSIMWGLKPPLHEFNQSHEIRLTVGNLVL